MNQNFNQMTKGYSFYEYHPLEISYTPMFPSPFPMYYSNLHPNYMQYSFPNSYCMMPNFPNLSVEAPQPIPPAPEPLEAEPIYTFHHSFRFQRTVEVSFEKIIRQLLENNANKKQVIAKAKQTIIKCVIPDQCQENSKIFDSIITMLQKKFNIFKKTKEEMIKFIFRRMFQKIRSKKEQTQNPIFIQLQRHHQKNLRLYKSMNRAFLNKEFSNPQFKRVFTEFVESLEDQFEEENNARVTKFARMISNNWSSIQNLTTQKKTPWTKKYKELVLKLARELCETPSSSTVNEHAPAQPIGLSD